MKTNRFFMLFAAIAMTAAVSCNKEEFGGPQDLTDDVASGVVFKATSELPVTKTAIDQEGNVTWKAGDKVAFYWQVDKLTHEEDTEAYPYVSEALAEDCQEAEFVIKETSKTFVDAFINNIKTENGRNLYAVYPASSLSTYYTDADHKALDITIPTEQDGTFQSASIALAKWSSAAPTQLRFRNLCALLMIKVSDENVRKIILKSDSEIAGTMQLTFKDDDAGDYPVVAKVLAGEKSISVNVAGPGEYYVAVRPIEIESLYVELKDEADVVVGGQTAGRAINAERACIYSLPAVTAPTDKLFVKTEAAGDGSGSSWDNAMTLASLESYMESAEPESKKVYIAAGTYVHTSAFYNMPVGFELYGGFPANASGYDLTGRDVKTNATIIDGGWDGTSTEHNKRIFVLQAGNWVFDGINFQNVRYSSKNHGSVLMVTAGTESAVLRNCSFTNCVNANTAYSGGALRIDAGCDVNMESCTFEQNLAQNGGAIYVAGNLNAVSCDFSKNSATISGGAILADAAAVVKLDKCEFTQNAANGESGGNGGGAVCLEAESTAKLYVNRSSFVKNTDKYNAHHIYTRSTDNHVGINNSVFRGPYGVKTTAGGLIQLKGSSVIVNTTIYGRTADWGAISLGSKTEHGCRIINDIVLNNSSNSLSFYTTSYNAEVYNTVYTAYATKDETKGNYTFTDCLAGAYARKVGDNAANFPTAANPWSVNDEMGTKFKFEDGRSFYAYAWEGTTEVGEVNMTSLAAIKELISGTANVGADFLTWLESEELKVNGVEALAVDIRGVARDTEAMWPGSYQEAAAAPGTDADAGAENFNVK